MKVRLGLRATVELSPGNSELQGTPGILVADPVDLANHASGDGEVLGADGPLLLPDRGDGTGTSIPFALLDGVDTLGGGIEERQCVVVGLDDSRSGIAVSAVAGHPQGGSGGDEPLGIPEVVLGSALFQSAAACSTVRAVRRALVMSAVAVSSGHHRVNRASWATVNHI